MEREFHRYGDVELFYAEAEDRSWSLPLYVEWLHDKAVDQHFARVRPADICLYHMQALTLVALLQVHDIRGRRDEWIIPRRICEAILHKAPGITPLFYYRWPEADAPPIEKKPPLKTRISETTTGGFKPKVESFVTWLAKDTKIASSIINAVLSAVASAAPMWMVQHHRPLDLGFCRLTAVPFRPNWKEIVAFKARMAGVKLRTILALPEDKRWEALDAAELPEMMCSPHNVGLRRGWKDEEDVARIDYTIETVASDSFEAEVNRIEGLRMARGAAAYVGEYEEAVEAVYQSAVLALRAYLKKVSAPHAEVGASRKPGVLGFLPVLARKTLVHGTPINRLPVHICPGDSRFSVFGRNDDPRLLPPPPAEVPALPSVLQEPSDVRGCEEQGDVDRSPNGEGDAARVLLLASGEIGDPGI